MEITYVLDFDGEDTQVFESRIEAIYNYYLAIEFGGNVTFYKRIRKSFYDVTKIKIDLPSKRKTKTWYEIIDDSNNKKKFKTFETAIKYYRKRKNCSIYDCHIDNIDFTVRKYKLDNFLNVKRLI